MCLPHTLGAVDAHGHVVDLVIYISENAGMVVNRKISFVCNTSQQLKKFAIYFFVKIIPSFV